MKKYLFVDVGKVKLLESKSRILVTRGRDKGEMGNCLIDAELNFCKMKKKSTCTMYNHVHMVNTILLQVLKWLRW